MRIISGKYKGRVIASPKNDSIRPTTDRAKEALFNIINYNIEGSSFLDLFAGSQNVGIEAESRGAQTVVCVDMSTDSKQLYYKNLEKIKMDLQFLNQKVEVFLKHNTQTFDYIFLDPPYNFTNEQLTEIFKLLPSACDENTLVIFEFESRKKFEFASFQQVDERKYGKSTFYMFQLGEFNE